MTLLVKRLGEKGWVRRAGLQADGRVAMVALIELQDFLRRMSDAAGPDALADRRPVDVLPCLDEGGARL